MIQGYRVLFDDRDVDQAANEAILAMDGNLSRAEGKRVAKAVFKSVGMEPKRANVPARTDAD